MDPFIIDNKRVPHKVDCCNHSASEHDGVGSLNCLAVPVILFIHKAFIKSSLRSGKGKMKLAKCSFTAKGNM